MKYIGTISPANHTYAIFKAESSKDGYKLSKYGAKRIVPWNNAVYWGNGKEEKIKKLISRLLPVSER